MDIADLNGCDFRRRLRFADRLSERAMALGLFLANTPRSRSSASLFCPTAADHFRGEGFAGPPDFALAMSPTPTCLYPAVGLAGVPCARDDDGRRSARRAPRQHMAVRP